jgi:hypothetical protein
MPRPAGNATVPSDGAHNVRAETKAWHTPWNVERLNSLDKARKAPRRQAAADRCRKPDVEDGHLSLKNLDHRHQPAVDSSSDFG